MLGEGVLKGKLLGTMRTSVSDGRDIVKVDHVANSCFLWKISYLGGCEDERGEDELFFSEALQMEFYQPVSKKAHRQRFHYLFSLSHDFMLHKGSRFLKCVGSLWALPI